MKLSIYLKRYSKFKHTSSYFAKKVLDNFRFPAKYLVINLPVNYLSEMKFGICVMQLLVFSLGGGKSYRC